MNNNNKQKYIDLTNRTMFHNDCVALEFAPQNEAVPGLRVIQHVEAAEVAELGVAGNVTPHAGPLAILSLAHFLVANPADVRRWLLACGEKNHSGQNEKSTKNMAISQDVRS